LSGTSNSPKSRPITVQKVNTIKIDGATGGQADLMPQQFQQVAPAVPFAPATPTGAPASIKPIQPKVIQPVAPQTSPEPVNRLRAGSVSRGFTLPVPRSVAPADPAPAAGMTDATLPPATDATLPATQ